jgi:outer membrane receptor for ferrienterochelin and colicins
VHYGSMLLLAVSALAVTAPAYSQEAPAAPTTLEPRAENGRQIYEVAQFARFAPQTALDMVFQIPGFQISEVSSDRGLGEASQNVLINGQRITGKSNDAQTALSRIAAASVIRLEIADAATLNVTGLNGQVLNVVTRPDSLQGNFAWKPQWRKGVDDFWINGEVNISGKLGAGDFTLGLNNNGGFRGGGWGFENVFDANGNLLFFRDTRGRFQGDAPRLAGTYSLKSKSGNIFNANAALQFNEFRGDRRFLKQEVGQTDMVEEVLSREDEWNFEFGADYEFKLGSGRLKLVGFHRFEHSPFRDIFRVTPAGGGAITGQQFSQTIDEGESVARAEYRWKGGKADWQISAEGAFNYLDSESAFFRLQMPGTVSTDAARIEEKRAQMILSYGRPIAKDLTLQATLGGEFSELGVSGPNGNARKYIRPKGSVSLAWKASPVLDVSAKLQRKVLQLNFYDFLASVDVRNNNNNAGNALLVPPQSWLLNLEANRSLGKAGSIKAKLDFEAISDIVDRIPITATTESPGNIEGLGKRVRAEISGSILLDMLGIKGGKLDIFGAWQKTSLRDPLTGATRPFSNRGKTAWNLEYRHDIPASDWAYGGFAEDGENYGFYRLDYYTREYRTGPMVGIFLEHKDVLGLKVRGTVFNLAGQTEGYDEIFYVDRRDGPVDFTTTGRNKYGLIWRLNVSGTF